MAADPPKEFAVKIKQLGKKYEKSVNSKLRRVVLDIGRALVERSPVGNPDTWVYREYADLGDGQKQAIPFSEYQRKAPAGYVGGTFRNSWQFGDGALPTGIEERAADKSGSMSIKAFTAGASGELVGKVSYLVNLLPYSGKLEYGHSKQAPAGMVGITATEFSAFMEKRFKETT